jgi:hypothetical protein
MTEQVASIQSLCEEAGIRRFTAAELVELVEDGEEISWIVDQVLPEGPSEVVQALSDLLSKIPVAVPPPDDADDDEDGPASPQEHESPADMDLASMDGLQLPAGVDQSQLEAMLASPRGALLTDFGSFCEERGLTAESTQALAQDGTDGKMKELHDEWLQTPRETLKGKKPSELLGGQGLFPEKVQTFRREAPKVGRNDPCHCGSGRKFKKCCGK